jgi:hypothetical protein
MKGCVSKAENVNGNSCGGRPAHERATSSALVLLLLLLLLTAPPPEEASLRQDRTRSAANASSETGEARAGNAAKL